MNYFVFLKFYFGAKNAWHGNSLVVRRVSQGRIIIVLFRTKYAVPRQTKSGILKLTTSRDQRNLRTVVSREEKRCYRIVSLGHQNFDCRSYWGLSRRMQSKCEHRKAIYLFQETPCSPPCGTILFVTKPICSKCMRRLVSVRGFYVRSS